MRYCPSCGTRYENDLAFCADDGVETIPMEDDTSDGVDPLIGQVLDGRYRIESILGEGGMGIVYRASHVVLRRPLAVKVLRGEMSKDAGLVERFRQEAQSATSIGHENIVDISDFGTLPDGTAYFVMEFLPGCALADLIEKGGSIPMNTALSIILEVASALAAAHARGIVHRDLKPDNIFLTPRGDNPHFVKVLDFGVAKVGGAASKLTKTGMVFGTPHYMAPEQAAGQAVDARTDIYALGIIMYEMFTGSVPFDAETFMGILSKHMFEEPVRPSSSSGVALGAVEDIILKALAKTPEDRYSSMDELASDLTSVSSGKTAVFAGQVSVPQTSLADQLEPPSRSEIPGRASKGSGMMLLGLALLGLILLVSGGALAAFAAGVFDGPTEVPVVEPDLDAGAVELADATLAVDAPGLAAETNLVEILSVPVGALVRVDGAAVGNTPVALDRPAGERVIEAEVRLAGYETELVRVQRDSPTQVTLTLRSSQVRPDPNPNSNTVRPPVMNPPPTNPHMGMSDPVMTPMMDPVVVPTEVIDPWNP